MKYVILLVSNRRLYYYCTKCTIVTLHSTKKCLQCYGFQMEVCAGGFPIDICPTTTATATHTHLYHHVMNSFMRIALHFKW